MAAIVRGMTSWLRVDEGANKGLWRARVHLMQPILFSALEMWERVKESNYEPLELRELLEGHGLFFSGGIVDLELTPDRHDHLFVYVTQVLDPVKT
jgi:hypothetical protein